MASTPRALVLVDGTNVARSAEWISRVGDLGDVGDLARRLVDAVASWAAATGRQVLIVFDGPSPGGGSPSCSVVGSGSGRTADDVIEREAAGARTASRAHWIVSSDRAVREVAGMRADRVLAASEFVEELIGTATSEAGTHVRSQLPADAGRGTSRLGDHADTAIRDQLERMRRGDR